MASRRSEAAGSPSPRRRATAARGAAVHWDSEVGMVNEKSSEQLAAPAARSRQQVAGSRSQAAGSRQQCSR